MTNAVAASEIAAGASGSLPLPAHRAPARRRRRRRLPTLISFACACGWVTLTAMSWPYYRLDSADRLHHPWHALLKPNGTIGLAYGYFGTALLLLLLLYSVRKRVRWLSGLRALSEWLDVHILCGLVGPGLITLHAGFKIHGLIAIGYWSMVAVLSSGFVGYYLYRQLPRAVSGARRDAAALHGDIEALDTELRQRYGLGDAQLAMLRRASGADRAASLGTGAALGYLVFQDLSMRFGLWHARLRDPALRKLGRTEARRLRRLVRQRVLAERHVAFLRQTEAAFGYWHTIHKPFAIMLYLMMGVHIGVAVWLGYAWAW